MAEVCHLVRQLAGVASKDAGMMRSGETGLGVLTVGEGWLGHRRREFIWNFDEGVLAKPSWLPASRSECKSRGNEKKSASNKYVNGLTFLDANLFKSPDRISIVALTLVQTVSIVWWSCFSK